MLWNTGVVEVKDIRRLLSKSLSLHDVHVHHIMYMYIIAHDMHIVLTVNNFVHLLNFIILFKFSGLFTCLEFYTTREFRGMSMNMVTELLDNIR